MHIWIYSLNAHTMKLQSLLVALAIQLALPLLVFGQSKTLSNVYLTQTFSAFENSDPRLDHAHYFEAMAARMHLAEASKMVFQSVVEGENGFSHYKYQQYHAGLPVFGNVYVLHEKGTQVLRATGRYSPQIRAGNQPSITPTAAIAKVKMDQKSSKFQGKTAKPVLCYLDPAFPGISESVRLAYQIDLQSNERVDKRRFFVDALTGKILYQYSLIQQEGVPSTAQTKYYGLQNIVTDSISPQQFLLRDLTRGQGITVSDPDGNIFTNNSAHWNLTNEYQDEVALDAHYCTQEYYDLLLQAFNWNGLDGNGGAMKAEVHDNGASNVNAYWDGITTNFGDGDCDYGPLTTLEVVGHEFTHGIVDYTSQLVYGGESGAINESLADMMGKALERKTDPQHFSWDLGHSFILSPNAQPFRIMDDPKSVGMPAYYNGMFWVPGNNVHVNSSIGNLWFSMLVDGKDGVNEAGVAYQVTELGMDKAAQIAFLCNKAYLGPSSDYNQFYTYSILAAEELYGAGSQEVQSVTEAWKAVGLPSAGPPVSLGLDLAVTSSGFISNPVCGVNVYHIVTIPIVNKGSIPYEPSMGAQLSVSCLNLPSLLLAITDPIAPGEVLNLEITNWLISANADYNFITADLVFPDSNLNNNSGTLLYQIVPFQSNDLYMVPNLEKTACFATTQHVDMFVISNSCETIPAGTAISFVAANEQGDEIWSSPYQLAEDLPGFSLFIQSFDLPIGTLQGLPQVTFRLDYPSDPDTSNNAITTATLNPVIIDGNYQNDFSLLDNFLLYEYVTNDPLIAYQGESYFGSTGLNLDPGVITTCADYVKNFNQGLYSGVNAMLSGCLDYSGILGNVNLDFDLVQFRNPYATAANNPYSSMFQASWIGSASGNEIIFGQPEGAVMHHSIPLPPQFKGALSLKLYTALGQWEVSPDNLSTDDFVLLDNVQLSITSATHQPNQDLGVQVSPNPAYDQVQVQAVSGIRSIQLLQANGQPIRQLEVNATRVELDLKSLPEGLYFLQLELENGSRTVQKLVKTF